MLNTTQALTMNASISFPFYPPSSALYLPLTVISLEDWALVTLDGPDIVKYLQSQLTIDITALSAKQHVLCGHCDANGKLWSTLRLFHRGDGFAYIARCSVLDNQLKAIKKYSVFSKVIITANHDAILLGVAGFKARIALESIFNILPNIQNQVVQDGNTTILQFSTPSEHFLLVTTVSIAKKLITALAHQAKFNNSCQWLTLNIEAGYPIIDIANSLKLMPQATNLQALHGISFSKGCYIGQEMITRTQFRGGANTRSLFWLEGHASRTPKQSEDLELQCGEEWRRIGTVLAASTLSNGMLWIQVVMNNNIDKNSKLRVRADTTSQLKIKPLPYN